MLATTQLTAKNILNAVPVPIFFHHTFTSLASGTSTEIVPLKAGTAYLILSCCVSFSSAGALNYNLRSSTTNIITHSVVGPMIHEDRSVALINGIPSGICLIAAGVNFNLTHDLAGGASGKVSGVLIEMPS